MRHSGEQRGYVGGPTELLVVTILEDPSDS